MLRYGLFGLFLMLLFAEGNTSSAQSVTPPAPTSGTTKVSLADVVRNLPEYEKPGLPSVSEVFENATAQERDSALPGFVAWLKDDRPRVRWLAVLSIGSLYLPSEKRPEPPCSAFLPVEYVPVVAARLKDSDAQVRRVTFIALQTVEICGHGMDGLVAFVVPMLRDPDILTEYPDPFFIESDKQFPAQIAKLPTETQAEMLENRRKMRERGVPKLPAEGPELLSIFAIPTWKPTNTVDDSIIAFLDREDQTKSTLGECLRVLALSRASERVNDEALRRVFEQKAMSVFLLQFVTELRLTPEQLAVQKDRLIAVSKDVSQRSSLRAAAKTVAACWGVDQTGNCRPTSEEFQEDNRIDSAEHQPR